MLFKLKSTLLLVLLTSFAYLGNSQCSGNYEIDFQVDPGNCENENILLTLNYLENNEDSIKVFPTGSSTPLQILVPSLNFDVYLIPDAVDSLTIIGYPSLCEVSWVKAELTTPFSAGFEFVSNSNCIYVDDRYLSVDPSGGWIFPGASYIGELHYPNGDIVVGDSFDVSDGIHIYQFIDEYGCYRGDTIDIVPAITIIDPFTVITTDSECDALTGTASINFINMQPPFTFDWKDENGISFSQESEVDQLAPGKYYIEIYDDICGAMDSFYIYSRNIQFEVFTADNLCLNDTNYLVVNILETGGGPYSYEWKNSNGTVVGTSDTLVVIDYDEYTVEVSSGICLNSQSIFVDPPFQLDLINAVVSCGDTTGCIEVQVTGGLEPYIYIWSWPSAPNTNLLCDVPLGAHELIVVDANGCSIVSTINMVQANPMLLNIESYPNSCTGVDDGRLIASVTGGSQPYLFNWSNNANTPAVIGASAGIYTITVTDANGCEIVGTTILEDGPMINNIETQCGSMSNLGNIQLITTNPFANLSYSWSNGLVTSDPILSNLSVGSYSVTVTDVGENCEEVYDNIFICDNSQGISNNYQICKGDSVEFNIVNPFGWTFISWVNPDFNDIDCDDCYDVWVYPEVTTTYEAAFSGPNNEIYFESILVEVSSDCVWPGDVDTNLVVDHFDLLPLAISLDEMV